MILERDTFCEEGIFGVLKLNDGHVLCQTLEHAYPKADGKFLPKIPPGSYICQKGIHRLSDGVPFETFEVKGIFGHSGLLFHVGNFNRDSHGCILVGKERTGRAVMQSVKAFQEFMTLLKGVETFKITIS